MVLSLNPNELPLSGDVTGSVWGMLMETNWSGQIVTLAAIADGTVSLYFNNGGGILGIGEHEEARRICKELLNLAPSFLNEFIVTTDFPLPQPGFTRFYLFTLDGKLTAEVKENELGFCKHSLSPLFHKAQELISQARMMSK